MVTAGLIWQRMWQAVLCCLLFSAAISAQAASSLTARVDKKPVDDG